jgi:hypothetical protein
VQGLPGGSYTGKREELEDKAVRIAADKRERALKILEGE